MNNKVAFLVDGGYFIRRIEFFHRKYFKSHTLTAEHITAVLLYLVNRHQKSLHGNELYRIFYYDAPPFEGQLRYPVSEPGFVGAPRTKKFKKDVQRINVIGISNIASQLCFIRFSCV